MNIYDFKVKDGFEDDFSLDILKGKVTLIVNVASECGFTPQYEGLQALYEKYKDKGLEIVGLPSNQFKEQEPGTNAEIQSFCKINYGVDFPIMSKIEVNGENEAPIYRFLKDQKPVHDDLDNPEVIKTKDMLIGLSTSRKKEDDIIWNFEKFLIDKEGNVLGRYSSATTPEELEKEIEKLI